MDKLLTSVTIDDENSEVSVLEAAEFEVSTTNDTLDESVTEDSLAGDAETEERVVEGAITPKVDPEIVGYIDHFTGGEVTGWLGSHSKEVFPYVTANGKPCLIREYGISRPDVKNATGLSENVGFIAELPDTQFSKVEFSLNAISMDGIFHVNSKGVQGAHLVPDSIARIFEAKRLSEEEGAVAIAVWEGTHNPIGRAQVLFNVLKGNRPTIIFGYDIGFSDTGVWEPLINSDCMVVMIPWEQREFYHNLMRNIGLDFDLVWICKPRLPAFEMAKSLSHTGTKYIIDLDDNELEMSSSKPSREKPYGLLSAKMAQHFIDKVETRSVASKTLQDDFGGEFVRHARKQQKVKRDRSRSLESGVRVGFIGTVRPHKGVVQAAKAIKALNDRNEYKIKFVVGGIYVPTSIRSELLELGCEVHGKIDSARLNGHLQNLDLVITGFPDEDANKEILKYQITSKIGDALSNERPVLVPMGASVADLDQIEGVHLFDSLNFERKLVEAITSSIEVKMDPIFSLDYNYEQFLKLEQQALAAEVTGRTLFGTCETSTANEIAVRQQKNVLLVWKQHDTGLYGRRVDHLARELSVNNYNVTCLELLSNEQLERYQNQSVRIDSDFNYILEDSLFKIAGGEKDGINYKTIRTEATRSTSEILKRFMLENEFFPTNTVVVLFPAVPDWKAVTDVMEGYPIICDVVDNQLAWEKRKPLELLGQYKHLMDISHSVVFNSEDNCEFFASRNYLEGRESLVIPNWYRLPLGLRLPEAKRIGLEKNHIDIVYSGNMNDRFDWDLVARLADEISGPFTIHLIGNCQRVMDKMTLLLDRPNIQYHGPMREKALLEFMSACDLAIMPHIKDEHSGFMNPMKVNMFREIGLPCVASDMPGVDFTSEALLQAADQEEFIYLVKEYIASTLSGQPILTVAEKSDSLDGPRYVELIESIIGEAK